MARRAVCLSVPVLLIALLGIPAGPRAEDAAPAAKSVKVSFSKDVAPLLSKYCISCHGDAKQQGGVNLEQYKDDAAALRDGETWDKVLKQLRAGEMPPVTRKQPTQAERDRLIRWINADVLAAQGPKNPGRVTLRRLNRTEYNNTVRDLFGMNFQVADEFPSDDVGYGFDNIGDVLSLPPLLLEKYLAVAEKVVETAFKSPDARKRILIAQPTKRTQDECSFKVLDHFARRAFRRPVTAEEINRLIGFVQLAQARGQTWEQGIQLALQAVLVSPHFLFRVELDREPDASGVHPINEYELATRLSYFLWSSMPDEELFRQATEGTLRQDLAGQVRRMLKDPKTRALVENFGGQWLQLRNLKTVTPDPKRFPGFDEELRAAMLKETELFFETVLREDRSVLDFLDADFTFVNERLAKHYGMKNVTGKEFRRVALTGGPRGGILTQASVLTLTSNPTRTSPVKRGKWILETILGTPPPPPPEAAQLDEDEAKELTGSLRQRMEQHRANPMCASCHQRMDPLGFGFENFDAVGRWRDKDGNFRIDASGELPSGQSFKGPKELKAILKAQKDPFTRCLAEKMLTYAVGRGMEFTDGPAIDRIIAALAANDYKFSTLILEIVKSDPFQLRKVK